MTCHLSASHLPLACHFFLKILRLYKDKDKDKDKEKEKDKSKKSLRSLSILKNLKTHGVNG